MRATGWMQCGLYAIVVCGLGLTSGRARAQASTMPTMPGAPSQTNSRLPSSRVDPDGDDTPMRQQQEHRRERAMVEERQKRMQEDTAKLLKLAEELKAEMEKTNKFQMSLEVIKKAEEIEKLARDVKTRMKG